MENKMKLFNRPTIYCSHAILGTTGDMEGNCKKAIKMVSRLRKVFPEIKFYVPAESDIPLQLLYQANKLSVEDIMWADLQILEQCNGWCFLKWDESNGSLQEQAHAIANDLVVPGATITDDVSKMSFTRIRKRFGNIVDKTIKHYKENK